MTLQSWVIIYPIHHEYLSFTEPLEILTHSTCYMECLNFPKSMDSYSKCCDFPRKKRIASEFKCRLTMQIWAERPGLTCFLQPMLLMNQGNKLQGRTYVLVHLLPLSGWSGREAWISSRQLILEELDNGSTLMFHCETWRGCSWWNFHNQSRQLEA